MDATKEKFMKRIGPLVAFTLIVVVGLASCAATPKDDQGDHEVATIYYIGDLSTASTTYKTLIVENDPGSGFTRMIHLDPPDAPNLRITGHDYDFDGEWDRVFYCGKHPVVEEVPGSERRTFGCNSAMRSGDGWGFEPCPADKEVVRPFSKEAIDFALTELNMAMENIHNQEHLSKIRLWISNQKELVTIYDDSSS